MAYTEIDRPDLYFNTKLYTGNGSTQSISGVNFTPDWVWIKNRDQADNHRVFDIVRGVDTNYAKLFPNLTNAENAIQTNELTSLDSDGFTLGNGASVNTNTEAYASWNWLAGGTASSNTNGNITSNVSANTTSGFSIVQWTGTGANGTIGHGLGVAPSMIIVKADAVKDWMVGHDGIGWTKYINLNTQLFASTASTVWQDTAPTSSVFSVGSSSDVNTSSTSMIAYCFAEKKGYSKFGSYKGNGNADGTFVYTGFRPAFVMLKRSDSSNNWVILDSIRDPFNDVEKQLLPNASDSEYTVANTLDLTSNGFKLRDTNSSRNSSSGTYIYMAFAENPFVTSTGVPATAR